MGTRQLFWTKLLILGFIHLCYADDDDNTIFELQDANSNGVEFNPPLLLNESYQIKFNENNNNQIRVTLALIHNLNDDENQNYTVTIKTNTNNAHYLDAKIEIDETSKKPLLRANATDYELLMDSDIFMIFVTDTRFPSKNIRIILTIINLDDEEPQLTIDRCSMEENDILQKCDVGLYDPDGFLNQMTFQIINLKEEDKNDEIFTITKNKTDFNNEKRATFSLSLLQELDYETEITYSFNISVTDSGSNSDSITTIVNVIDMPDMPPYWTSFIPTLKVIEKTSDSFFVKAKDGDVIIDAVINYNLTESNEFVSINTETGQISIKPIDRDAGNDQVVFTVIAYEKEDLDSATPIEEGEITLLVEDVDDSIPEFTDFPDENNKVVPISIRETEVEEIENKIFNVIDKDIGENAIFTLEIEADDLFKDNFNIVPAKGYESTNISIIVKDASKLDYEDEQWQHIQFDIVSKGTKTPANSDRMTVDITLIDWNDEWPIFNPTEYTATVKETIGKNEEIQIGKKSDTDPDTIKATDRDAEDAQVKHEILGTILTNSLAIEEFGGKITTLKDNVFDYDKQTEVFVQIQATDNAEHKAIAQLTITVIDVNNKDPKFDSVGQIKIDENREDGTVLEVEITATDVDTDCLLTFSIIWDESKAVKNLQEYTDFQNLYEGFLTFETEQTDQHTFKGTLTIKDVVENNTPDFEKFDTVYLSILVNDTNTEVGEGTDKAIITINIGNLNDNDPEFTEETKNMKFTVVENSIEGIIIGLALATDADNLQPISYSIDPKTDTDEGLVTIDPKTGQLRTTDQIIDCDEPKREYIFYTITASDGERYTSLEIQIYIIDLNDNKPELTGANSKQIDEDFYMKPSKQDGTLLYNLEVIDKDRSPEYNEETVVCMISSGGQEMAERFTVENGKELKVALKNDATLDREYKETYSMTIQCRDNPTLQGGTQNTIENPPEFVVTLLDLNDWTPTILPTGLIQTNENINKDTLLDLVIQAEDKDKDESGIVKSSITNIKCSDSSSCKHSDEDITDLFKTIQVEGQINQFKLQTTKDLRTYYGVYDVTIKVEDTPKNEPSLSSEKVVQVEVQKFNFESPSFENLDASYYLDPNQKVGQALVLSTGDTFQAITATDNQDHKYTFTYEVQGSSLFTIQPKSNSEADLHWNGPPTDNKDDVTITVTAIITQGSEIAGEKEYDVSKTIKFSFISIKDTDPQFEKNTETFDVLENTVEPVLRIPQADYQGIDLDLEKYYLLKDQSEFFNVDITDGTITLKAPLDYETETVHELIIYASNSQNIKPQPNPKSILTVTINVLDVNDNPPVFEHEVYNATVTVGSSSKTNIITVKATDVDTVGSILTYSITKEIPPDNFNLNGPYFAMEPKSGQISVNFLVSEEMSGFFDVSIRATDEPPEENAGDALVKIHIVNKENTVNFKFENPSQTVTEKLNNIEQILTNAFGYATHAESPSKDSTAKDSIERTVVPIYFIDETTNTPILGTEILKRITSAQTFADLKAAFLDDSLILLSFESTGGNETNTNEILKAWLIGITVLLGGLIVVLIVAFVLRNRSLTNRIKNLSSTKFGSQESGLNRIGLAIPTANRNAVEGANPVYKNNREEEEEEKKSEIDHESIASGDSDLIGVEDNPEFDSKEAPNDDLRY